MKPAPFEYHAPTTLAEALALLRNITGDALVLAGGQTLVPLLNMRLARPDAIVDLNRIPEIAGLEFTKTELRVGAMVRHMTLENDATVRKRIPLLAEAARHIAHLQIRTRGTIGGSLANAAPASEWTAVVSALEAIMVVQSAAQGTRELTPDSFFAGAMMTTLEPDEMLVEIRIPIPQAGTGWAFVESARRHGDFALAGAAVLIALDAHEKIASARIAMCGMEDPGLRLGQVEAGLVGTSASASDLDDAESLILSTLDAPDDFHLSAESRRQVAATIVRRALAKAIERARGARGK